MNSNEFLGMPKLLKTNLMNGLRKNQIKKTFGGPGGGFGGPGGGFSDNRSSGKPLLLLRLKNHPQDYKNQYQDHQDHPCTRY